MASSPHVDPENPASRTIDPAADLDLLERSRSVVDVDQALDFGPWWYAPLLATMIGGLTLYGHDTTAIDNQLSGLVALSAATIVGVHDYRRRSARSRLTIRGVGILGVILLISWVLVAAWGTAVSSLGYERFVPGYAMLAWVLTSLGLLGIRAGSYAIRRHRRALV